MAIIHCYGLGEGARVPSGLLQGYGGAGKTIDSIDLSTISVVDPGEKLVTVLSLAMATAPGISNISFNGNSVNGVYLRAAHIYRMDVD